MKIVIFVNYSSPEFNTDFNLSNQLIGYGHNVFLAVNDDQFLELKKNCDKAVLGLSAKNKRSEYLDCIVLENAEDINYS